MSRRPTYRFRLYLAGEAQNSLQASANLTSLCRTRLAGRHEIEIVDVFRDPERALKDGIFMTPTLIKLGPLPVRRIVGSLSDLHAVLTALGLESATA